MYSVVRKETNEQGEDRFTILASYDTKQEAFRLWQSIDNKLGLEIMEGIL